MNYFVSMDIRYEIRVCINKYTLIMNYRLNYSFKLNVTIKKKKSLII
jgi:hypothetical protein